HQRIVRLPGDGVRESARGGKGGQYEQVAARSDRLHELLEADDGILFVIGSVEGFPINLRKPRLAYRDSQLLHDPVRGSGRSGGIGNSVGVPKSGECI